MSPCSCQALIAWPVADYTADVTCNVRVVASCSPGVMKALWRYAKLCVLPPFSFPTIPSGVTCCRIKLFLEDGPIYYSINPFDFCLTSLSIIVISYIQVSTFCIYLFLVLCINSLILFPMVFSNLVL